MAISAQNINNALFRNPTNVTMSTNSTAVRQLGQRQTAGSSVSWQNNLNGKLGAYLGYTTAVNTTFNVQDGSSGDYLYTRWYIGDMFKGHSNRRVYIAATYMLGSWAPWLATSMGTGSSYPASNWLNHIVFRSAAYDDGHWILISGGDVGVNADYVDIYQYNTVITSYDSYGNPTGYTHNTTRISTPVLFVSSGPIMSTLNNVANPGYGFIGGSGPTITAPTYSSPVGGYAYTQFAIGAHVQNFNTIGNISPSTYQFTGVAQSKVMLHAGPANGQTYTSGGTGNRYITASIFRVNGV
jgi:hypothetical protein